MAPASPSPGARRPATVAERPAGILVRPCSPSMSSRLEWGGGEGGGEGGAQWLPVVEKSTDGLRLFIDFVDQGIVGPTLLEFSRRHRPSRGLRRARTTDQLQIAIGLTRLLPWPTIGDQPVEFQLSIATGRRRAPHCGLSSMVRRSSLSRGAR